MTTSIEPSFQSLNKKLHSLEQAIKNKELITDSLTVMSKGSIRYVILKLCAPFYYLFNKDPFEHVRIDRVFSSLYAYLEKNGSYLKSNLDCVFDLKEHLIQPLSERVKDTNKKIVASYEYKISKLFTPASKHTIWPEDLSSIGITTKEKMGIDSLLLNFHKMEKIGANASFCFLKEQGQRKLILKSKDQIIQTTEMSNSLFSVKIDGIVHLILSSKKNVGSGGERKKIRLCWDLTEGKKLVKKPLVSILERGILKILQDRNIPNILSIKGIIGSHKPNSFGKTLEEFYPHTLASLIEKPDLLSFSQKIDITKQLIYSLCKMHQQKIDLNLSLNNQTPSLNSSIMFYHKDIKPSNILIKEIKKNIPIEAVISDFGSSCDPFSLSYSIPYRPPELLIFSQKKTGSTSSLQKRERVLNYNRHLAQAGDIWSFGLTLMILFYPKGYKTPTQLLPSLKNFQSNYSKSSLPLDQGIFDKELEHIYDEIASTLLADQKTQFDHLWTQIIIPALLICPINRADAPFLLNSAKALKEMI